MKNEKILITLFLCFISDICYSVFYNFSLLIFNLFYFECKVT